MTDKMDSKVSGVSGESLEETSKKSSREEFFSPRNLLSLAAIVVGVLAFRWTVGAPYEVPTSSMEPTIMAGDRLIGNHLAYHLRLPFIRGPIVSWGLPERGDIIVFQGIENPEIDMVKRVVALAGERIYIEDGKVVINGEVYPLAAEDGRFNEVTAEAVDDVSGRKLYIETFPDQYQHWVLQSPDHMSPLHNWPGMGREYIVPKDHVLVLGDNRDNSKDSRFWGPVPIEKVYGRAEFVLWSMRPMFQDSGFQFHLRWHRFGKRLHTMP